MTSTEQSKLPVNKYMYMYVIIKLTSVIDSTPLI